MYIWEHGIACEREREKECLRRKQIDGEKDKRRREKKKTNDKKRSACARKKCELALK